MMRKKYIAPALSLVLVGVLLACTLVLFFGRSFAWFSINDRNRISGIHISASGVPDTEQYLMVGGVRLDDAEGVLFSDLVPGDTVTFEVCIVNKTNKAIECRRMLAPPTEDEEQPYIKDERYHYMGTQLRIDSVKSGEQELLSLTGNERYLLPLDDSLYIGEDHSLPPTSIAEEYDFTPSVYRDLTPNIEIAAGGTLVLEVEIEFVDNGLLQNAYIEYGNLASEDPAKGSLRFSRTLVCYSHYKS